MLPDDLTDALLELSRTPVLLVASDYDGVIAPIVTDPNEAHPKRETAVALGEGILLDATVRVKLPAPLAPFRRSAQATAPAGAGRFAQDVAVDGMSLVVRSQAVLAPYARVPAADYDAFTRFCAEVDAAESQLVR